ncbi:hypothetical protein [Aromatoleum aromaticum]|uniref:hypothetical protein n=1 Tax=Aromatoleum aromaticum TaxID=551760 RepID=UPI0005A02B4D|nr:hypothetical protein [Aromatoleum aromaticum]
MDILFVKLLARLVHAVHSIEKKSSKQQLQDDFGEFPPEPLRCESLTGEFSVTRVRGIGELYHEFVVRKALLQAAVSDMQFLSSDFVTAFGVNEIRTLQREISKLGRGSKVAERLFVVLGLGWMLARTTLKRVGNGPRRRILGHFMPLFENTSHIVVKSGRHVRKSRAIAPKMHNRYR